MIGRTHHLISSSFINYLADGLNPFKQVEKLQERLSSLSENDLDLLTDRSELEAFCFNGVPGETVLRHQLLAGLGQSLGFVNINGDSLKYVFLCFLYTQTVT